MRPEEFMRQAIGLSRSAIEDRFGGPFGAVVVKNGEMIASGQNRVLLEFDPTCHAEIVAIRGACQALRNFSLAGCELFTSCEPCPMCLGAIYWSRLDRVYYANTRVDAAKIGFDDDDFYKEIALPSSKRSIPFKQILRDEAAVVFREWSRAPAKQLY